MKNWIEPAFLVPLLAALFGFVIDQGCLGLSPSIQGLTDLRREFTVGENLLLTCVVNNIGHNIVIWSKVASGRRRIIAIDKLTVTQDGRIRVLHNKAPTSFNSSLKATGGDVWVLSIKNVTEEDSGGYICRVNSEPITQSYYMVAVSSRAATTQGLKLRSSHNYTTCCEQNGVDPKCVGFCNLHDILEGRTGIEPEKCENQFPKIVQCMADFRDHSSCCERQGIPDICQDLCRGEYTVQDDYVKSHFSCTAFTEATLLCISEGVEILPQPPRDPSVTVISSKELLVGWMKPDENSPPYDHFIINITTIKSFDPPIDVTLQTPKYSSTTELDSDDEIQFIAPKKMQIRVPADVTNFTVNNLTPMTWYEISVTSVNQFGSSLALYSIRSLTNSVTSPEPSEIITPEIPDIVGCCISKGVKDERCLQNLCNPKQRYIEEPDMIVCAAWAKESFSCLTGGIDHSECCRSRGLPDICIKLCSGNVTHIDYSYFKCVDYFSDYRSCLLKGYGVLPGVPRNIRVDNVQPTFALLSWDLPIQNKDSITSFHAYFRPISPSRECYRTSFSEVSGTSYLGVQIQHSPQVLEDLCENTEYEVYIEAFNAHGTSDPSSRILFKTPSYRELNPIENVYNASTCCSIINVSPGCLPLCNYNVRMSHFQTLSKTCTPEMPKVFRCIVGGRDHTECCIKRGVPSSCQNLCTGSTRSEESTPTRCLSYIGNIFMCLEEGINALPGPVTSLHATEILNTTVTLQWEPPKNSSKITNYEVHYQEVDKYSATHAVFQLNNTINVTRPIIVLTDLKKFWLYNIFVISVNDWGTSLPSSILTINTTSEGSKTTVAGVPSAPHSLRLEAKTANSLTVLWQPPSVLLPTDRLRYTLHYATLSIKNNTPFYNQTSTSSTALRLDELKPNTQYVIFVMATNDMGESRPSETLLAWTDPSYPAFVEAPTVHPTNKIIEGGTMTILCIGMGSPKPKLSLYISGVLFHQEVSRHMATVVMNVTRNMTEISCYADNGYGTPMQSSVSITVSYRPTIIAEDALKVIIGSKVTLECQVSAWPKPSLVWWKDVDKRTPVINGGNMSIATINQSKGKFLMRLTLSYAEQSDYYCHASNELGSFTHTVKVETWDKIRQPLNALTCCILSNVSITCLKACEFDQIDFHKEMNRDECIPDIGKLVQCGADQSDHRGCCAKNGVPRHCLDWCRSRTLAEPHLNKKCLLEWAPSIFHCFAEGLDTLPNSPQNVYFESITPSTAKVSWDIPTKNAEMIKLYRVFWRPKNTEYVFTKDTSNTSLYINNLTQGETYEVAVKAGNHLGTSVLTSTKLFLHQVSYVSSRSMTGSAQAGIWIGVCLALALVIGLGGFAWWTYKRRQNLMKSDIGIAFDNPSYSKEQTDDTVKITEAPIGGPNGTIPSSMNVPLTNGSATSNGSVFNERSNKSDWKSQSMNSDVPGFEEDLDSKGGYKRFKS